MRVAAHRNCVAQRKRRKKNNTDASTQTNHMFRSHFATRSLWCVWRLFACGCNHNKKSAVSKINENVRTRERAQEPESQRALSFCAVALSFSPPTLLRIR